MYIKQNYNNAVDYTVQKLIEVKDTGENSNHFKLIILSFKDFATNNACWPEGVVLKDTLKTQTRLIILRF